MIKRSQRYALHSWLLASPQGHYIIDCLHPFKSLFICFAHPLGVIASLIVCIPSESLFLCFAHPLGVITSLITFISSGSLCIYFAHLLEVITSLIDYLHILGILVSLHHTSPHDHYIINCLHPLGVLIFLLRTSPELPTYRHEYIITIIFPTRSSRTCIREWMYSLWIAHHCRLAPTCPSGYLTRLLFNDTRT